MARQQPSGAGRRLVSSKRVIRARAGLHSLGRAVPRAEARIGQVFGTENEIILMQGEAILGLEAAARALVRPGMHVLNLASGVFGKGMGYWLKAFGAQLHEIETSYAEAIDPAAVAACLDEHPEIELLSVVHCETPSGTFNDCAAIGPIARSRGVLILVDCVASLGGMALHPDAWQLDVCVAGPQKCLAGPSGMSLVAVSGPAWAAPTASGLNPAIGLMALGRSLADLGVPVRTGDGVEAALAVLAAAARD